MQRVAIRLLTLIIVLAGGVLGAGTARAAGTCHTVNAKGVGQITNQTLAGATTVSRIIGGGLLHGTTAATLSFTSVDPATGMATFVGTLELTTRHGMATLAVTDGVFNTQTGEFRNDSVVTGGTGRLAGATGSLFFHGVVAPDGHFTDDTIRGTVCVDMP